ncbi:cilia- and flagella-associated protein 263-like [Onthophagus taurus]|uniref:cilia- and flagella-associated protein 263-like n=1 Tax=Onthophagus taurus TaxID=166361 RepID=UPI000C1FDAB8|nr:coiled-coil domain-containing protein 113-like [Onthophagus taurus]
MGSSDSSSINYDAFTPEDLILLSNRKLVEITKNFYTDLKRLMVENDIFEHFLTDHNVYNPESFTRLTLNPQNEVADTKSIKSMRLSHKQILLSDDTLINNKSEECLHLGMRINFDEKLELASAEMQNTRKEMKRFMFNMKKQIGDESVHLEGDKLDYDDIEKTRNQFECFITAAIQLEINQKLPAEKFVKFMRDWHKSGHDLLEKLRIKVNNQKIQLRKLREQRDIKEPLHSMVNEVDIFVLNLRLDGIKNDLKLKNSLFLQSKTMLNKASHDIIQMKKTIGDQQQECVNLSEETAATQLCFENYMDAEKKLCLEIANMRKQQQLIKDRVKHYQCPSINDYLMSKHELRRLKHQLKQLKEKFKTQKEALKSYKIIMKQLERRKCDAMLEWNWMNLSSSNISVCSTKMILPVHK